MELQLLSSQCGIRNCTILSYDNGMFSAETDSSFMEYIALDNYESAFMDKHTNSRYISELSILELRKMKYLDVTLQRVVPLT